MGKLLIALTLTLFVAVVIGQPWQ
uniref:Uncharacterized protein n=1 Tax=Megaselia scalaris TaxID=36166 RepID=T1GNW6_MEGSC